MDQFGGLKEGLLSVTYHVFTEDCVAIDPISPAIRQVKMETVI